MPDIGRKNMCKVTGFSTYIYNDVIQSPISGSPPTRKYKLGLLQIIMPSDSNATKIKEAFNEIQTLKRIELIIPDSEDNPDSNDKPKTKQVYIFHEASCTETKIASLTISDGSQLNYEVISYKFNEFAIKNTIPSGNYYSTIKET